MGSVIALRRGWFDGIDHGPTSPEEGIIVRARYMHQLIDDQFKIHNPGTSLSDAFYLYALCVNTNDCEFLGAACLPAHVRNFHPTTAAGCSMLRASALQVVQRLQETSPLQFQGIDHTVPRHGSVSLCADSRYGLVLKMYARVLVDWVVDARGWSIDTAPRDILRSLLDNEAIANILRTLPCPNIPHNYYMDLSYLSIVSLAQTVRVIGAACTCAYCGTAMSANLRPCARCGRVCYCSQECLDAHWRDQHQHHCEQWISRALSGW